MIAWPLVIILLVLPRWVWACGCFSPPGATGMTDDGRHKQQ